MNQINNSPNCERAVELVSFLYGESGEGETRDFQTHLRHCRSCQAELAAFGDVRESIAAWRDEALTGFVSSPAAATPNKRSAIAALRQFFDLSPLWLKGAVGFAVVSFCMLAAFALVGLHRNDEAASAKTGNPDAVYTHQDMDRIVKEALAKQASAQQPVQKNSDAVVAVKSPPPPRRSSRGRQTQIVKGREPLSKAEREQLAADLRLLSTHDDFGLDLLGDRINQ